MKLSKILTYAAIAFAIWWVIQEPTSAAHLVHNIGALLSDAAQVINPIKGYWWLLVFPVIAMSLTLLALNFLGDGLRDALDPRSAGKS